MRKISIAFAMCISVAANASQFMVTVSNNGPQPLSPMFWSIGNSSFDIFQFGGTASAGIKSIAESGNAAPMLALASGAGANLQGFGTIGGSPLMPGNSRTAVIDMNPGDDFFSFAMMLGQTNDGFLGESVSSMGLRLFSGATPTGFSVNIYGARAWDAGTEENTQNAADLGFLGGSGNPADSIGAIRVHGSVINGIGDSFALMPDWNSDTRLATVTVLPVPEPASLSILALGGMALLRRNRKSR